MPTCPSSFTKEPKQSHTPALLQISAKPHKYSLASKTDPNMSSAAQLLAEFMRDQLRWHAEVGGGVSTLPRGASGFERHRRTGIAAAHTGPRSRRACAATAPRTRVADASTPLAHRVHIHTCTRSPRGTQAARTRHTPQQRPAHDTARHAQSTAHHAWRSGCGSAHHRVVVTGSCV